jgi:hypothetical protein
MRVTKQNKARRGLTGCEPERRQMKRAVREEARRRSRVKIAGNPGTDFYRSRVRAPGGPNFW